MNMDLATCCALVKRLVFTEQYENAQETIGFHLVGSSSIPEGFAFTIYRAYRAITYGTHSRKELPKYIGTWLSKLACCESGPVYSGVGWGDIMEMWETPCWVQHFNWARLAVGFRDKLEDMKADPFRKGRLPPSIWKVVEAAWLMLDIDSTQGLKALQVYFDVHGYDVAEDRVTTQTTASNLGGSKPQSKRNRRRGGHRGQRRGPRRVQQQSSQQKL